jgi:hypothetical protein
MLVVNMAGWAKREENGFCLNVIHCIEQPRQSGQKAWWGYGGVARNWLPKAARGRGKFLPVGKIKRDKMGETRHNRVIGSRGYPTLPIIPKRFI